MFNCVKLKFQADRKEGMTAFIEKRQPKFNNQ